ncbi:MAG: PadR family transcriptional regulator [Proteobacteria bacterium]|nr:MAG: PadR family transcriptional regulator [Pseudomonadota bacterium]
MAGTSDNWKTQIRKGYLELCVLLLIQRHKKLYGFDLIEKLSAASLEVKEGTLYPLLNRMSADGVLGASWETENIKGHPRKFYSLTKEGTRLLTDMESEFTEMVSIFKQLSK